MWAIEKSTILAYIDVMLISASESSPHTTPAKKGNRVLYSLPEYLDRKWSFETRADDEEVEDGETEDENIDYEDAECRGR